MAFVYWIHLAEHTNIKTQGYVGITTESVQKRYKRGHMSSARTGSKLHVHAAIRKYGEKIIVTTVLEDDIEFCQLVEWGYRPSPDIGWNHGIGGDSPRVGSTTSEETKAKLSLAGKGRKIIGAALANMREAAKNRIWTDADRERMAAVSKARRGIKLTPEHRKKLSESSNRDSKFSDVAKQKAREFHNSQPPWERGRSNPEVWKLSYEMFSHFKGNETIGEVALAKCLGVAAYQVRKILKKFREGWNPLQDSEFSLWLEKHTNTKGPHESTCTT